MKSQECEIATANEVKASAAQGQCNIAQSEKVQSAEAEQETHTLDKQMRALISQNIIEKLIRMDERMKDRDYSEGWMRYENFADFYAEMSPLFMVAFSRPELLVSSILEIYVTKQVYAKFMPLDQRLREKVNLAAKTLFSTCIAENYDALATVLQQKWPREYADILNRNARFKPMMGMH